MMIRLFNMSLIAFSLVGASTLAHADLKLGTVDMQKALQTVEAGKKAKSQLEKEVNEKKAEIEKEKAAITKMGEEFKKQALVMNEEARGKKQAELQERILKLQEKAQKTEMELRQKEQSLTQPIIGKIREIISNLAKEKGYTMVLEKNENTILFSLDKDDLTTEVISNYNSGKKS
jgi:outer membrane protein